jgi:hypothetical protein
MVNSLLEAKTGLQKTVLELKEKLAASADHSDESDSLPKYVQKESKKRQR